MRAPLNASYMSDSVILGVVVLSQGFGGLRALDCLDCHREAQ